MATRQPRQEDRKSPLDDLNLADTAVFGFSWMLVMAVGLMPIVEASLKRSPSISMPVTIAFFVAVASGIALRRRYNWMGLVLHIFGQIVIGNHPFPSFGLTSSGLGQMLRPHWFLSYDRRRGNAIGHGIVEPEAQPPPRP